MPLHLPSVSSSYFCLQLSLQPGRLGLPNPSYPVQISASQNTRARPALLAPREGAGSETTLAEVKQRRAQQNLSRNMQKWQGQNVKGTPGSHFSDWSTAVFLLFRKGQILPHSIMTLQQPQAVLWSWKLKPHLKMDGPEASAGIASLVFTKSSSSSSTALWWFDMEGLSGLLYFKPVA